MTAERLELIRQTADMRGRLPLELAVELLAEVVRLQEQVAARPGMAEVLQWTPPAPMAEDV